MDVVIRKAELQDLDLLMRWRMEVLHEVFSIPADQPLAELEAENRRYYQKELPQGGHIACFVYIGEEIVGCGGIPDECLCQTSISWAWHSQQACQMACRTGSRTPYFKNIPGNLRSGQAAVSKNRFF